MFWKERAGAVAVLVAAGREREVVTSGSAAGLEKEAGSDGRGGRGSEGLFPR